MAVTSKLVPKLSPVAATANEFALQVHGLAILALAAAHSHLDVSPPFAANDLIVLSAAKFGFRLVKPKKFAAPSTDAKLVAKTFLAHELAGSANLAQKQLTTA